MAGGRHETRETQTSAPGAPLSQPHLKYPKTVTPSYAETCSIESQQAAKLPIIEPEYCLRMTEVSSLED
jgi:hypothetical protein